MRKITGKTPASPSRRRGAFCRAAETAKGYAWSVNEFQPLIDQLYREEILRARAQTPQQRLAGAFEMAPLAHSFMYAGIRHQHPDADDAELLRLARERIAKIRRLDELKIYRAVEAPE